MRSGSLINPNQIALSMSCSIRSEILRMVSSERYDVILMLQDGVRQPWGFSPLTNWKHPHQRLPHQGNRSRKRMQPFRWELHPQRMWKCKWIYPCLKHTPDSPRMGKICASSWIGFRLQKIQPPVWQLDDWTSYEIVVQIYAIINPSNHSIPYTQKDLILLLVLS